MLALKHVQRLYAVDDTPVSLLSRAEVSSSATNYFPRGHKATAKAAGFLCERADLATLRAMSSCRSNLPQRAALEKATHGSTHVAENGAVCNSLAPGCFNDRAKSQSVDA